MRLDHVLEIAAVVTGPDLQPLAEVEKVIRQPDDVLDRMSARVKKSTPRTACWPP